MKRISVGLAAVISLGVVGISLGATPVVPAAGTKTTPVPLSNYTGKTMVHKDLDLKIHQALQKIHTDEKSGKLGSAQVKGYRDKVRDIRKQEFGLIKQSANKDLTEAQLTSLEQQLASSTSAL